MAAQIASIINGKNGTDCPMDTTNGEIILPTLEKVIQAPTPTFLITVGYNSPVNKYKVGVATLNYKLLMLFMSYFRILPYR